MSKEKSVGVIGLGPAGLAMVKELKNNDCFGVVRGFDRCSRVGGRWALDREAYKAGVWEELCANVSRSHMEYSDFPWTAEDEYNGHELAYAGIFPHCTEVQAYMEAYARKFDLYPNLQLETEVKSIERVGGESWKITTASRNGGALLTTHTHELFDALVVCNGAQAKPYHPLESRFQNFDGEVIHSEAFRSEKDYKDKRVLVIGSNVSGSEIASILARESTKGGCQKAVHSVRRMPYHIQKLVPGSNIVSEDIFAVRSVAWLSRVMPESMLAEGLKGTVLGSFPEQCDAANMPNCSVGVSPDVRKSGVALTTFYVDEVKQGNLTVKGEVTKVDGKKVTFSDDTTEEFDAVVCATGYDFDLSFLPESIREKVGIKDPDTGKTILALYKNTLVPNAELVDNLAFCGIHDAIGPYFPQTEIQARYIAAIWSQRIPCPRLSALQSNAEAAKNKRLDKTSVLNQVEMGTGVCEEIGDELGITPGYMTALWNPRKYLAKPVFSSFYRNNPKMPDTDETVAAKSLERFEQLVASCPRVAQA
mmetsp:Transcript_13948/g.32528  ORF Transcript_13948/g.32528 Transcript_13948/m.32528 type:complete len:534 (-) Transcript_13948:52-1653(-)